jgi:hypothetical protein
MVRGGVGQWSGAVQLGDGCGVSAPDGVIGGNDADRTMRSMLGWLRTLLLYRFLGGRAVLALAAIGWLWRRLSGGRGERGARGGGDEDRRRGRVRVTGSR